MFRAAFEVPSVAATVRTLPSATDPKKGSRRPRIRSDASAVHGTANAAFHIQIVEIRERIDDEGIQKGLLWERPSPNVTLQC